MLKGISIKKIIEALDNLEGDVNIMKAKYVVEADYGENQVNFETNKPKEAIAKWVEWQKKYPMSVEIYGKKGTDTAALYNWVFNNLDEFAKMITKQKAYKTNYLYKEVQAVNLQTLDVKNSGLHPFTVG